MLIGVGNTAQRGSSTNDFFQGLFGDEIYWHTQQVDDAIFQPNTIQ